MNWHGARRCRRLEAFASPSRATHDSEAQERNSPDARFSALLSGYVMSMFYRSFLAIVAGDLGRDLGFGASELSGLSSAWLLVFALSQFPLGPALDRFGAGRTVAACSLLTVHRRRRFALSQSHASSLAAMAIDRGRLRRQSYGRDGACRAELSAASVRLSACRRDQRGLARPAPRRDAARARFRGIWLAPHDRSRPRCFRSFPRLPSC